MNNVSILDSTLIYESKFVVLPEILDLPSADCANRILCCYVNCNRKGEIIRFTNIPNLHLGVVVILEKRLLSEVSPKAEL